jgi:hypothetical protein
MTPHPILDHHQINDRFGEGLREAARRRLINQAYRARQAGWEPSLPESSSFDVVRRLAAAWSTFARKADPT